ncbi:MAG: hypothetical protein ACXWZS_14390, partial [Gemmatirosa sp.]
YGEFGYGEFGYGEFGYGEFDDGEPLIFRLRAKPPDLSASPAKRHGETARGAQVSPCAFARSRQVNGSPSSNSP